MSKNANASYTTSCGEALIAPDADLTRPANTTAYAANYSIGTASNCLLTYSSFFEAVGDNHLLTNARLIIQGSATVSVPSGIAIRAYLFTSDVTATVLSSNADQATYKQMFAAESSAQGYIDFSTFATGGTGSDAMVSIGVPSGSTLHHLKSGAASRALYAILVATAAFTPISASVHRLVLGRGGI